MDKKKNGRVFVMGDLHGRYKALQEVLARSSFKKETDTLILLGDLCDGGKQTKECIELLSSFSHCIFVIGNHDCFHKDTEFLTSQGWKRYEDITREDSLGQVDMETKELSFDKYISRGTRQANNLIQIEGNNFCQLVTPSHDVIFEGKKVKASSLVGKQFKEDSLLYNISEPKVSPSIPDNIIRAITCVVCDGTIVKRSEQNYRIQFKISNPEKIEYIKQVMDSCGFSYTFRKATKTGVNVLQPYYICLYGDSARSLVKYFPDGKHYPRFFKELNHEQVKVFLDAITHTDGSLNNQHDCNTKNISLVTVDKGDADLIQEVCLKNNIPSHITEKMNRSGFPKGKKQYCIIINRTPKFMFYVKVQKIPYYDRVCCFQMPKGTLVTRFHGKTAVTGNCWFIDYIRSEAQPHVWLSQGGIATLRSYGGLCIGDAPEHGPWGRVRIPEHHKEFLNNGVYFYIYDNMLFVHGGISPMQPVEQQNTTDLTWDRSMAYNVIQGQGFKYESWHFVNQYSHIFLGHTAIKDRVPKTSGRITCLDTGAGHCGKLTIMDIYSKEYWQSDQTGSCDPEVVDDVVEMGL